MQAYKDQLQKLVVERGVGAARGKECADQLYQALGQATIQQIFSSPKRAGLKARASLVTPEIRIVLADELHQLIQAKAQTARPVGNKSNKIKQKQMKKIPLQLRADMLEVPHAVFKQTDGAELGQIAPADIIPGSKGVAIVNIQEALPYFQLQEVVSQQGAALLSNY